MTPNPDTNPELFDPVVSGYIQEGDLFDEDHRGDWEITQYEGKPWDWMGGQRYYRRKTITQKEKQMKVIWHPVENGTPGDIDKGKSRSRTVLIAYSRRTSPSSVEHFDIGYFGYPRSSDNPVWCGNDYEQLPKSPKFWAEIPYEFFEFEEVKERPIVIQVDGDEMEIEFTKDGSVSVGCTTVDSKTMDRIIEHRKKAQGK